MKTHDYLLLFTSCTFCIFTAFLAYFETRYSQEQMNAQYQDYMRCREEVRELRKEVNETRKEQAVITDCLLNKRWD